MNRGRSSSREALERSCRERILARFDHRNLNTDIAELTGVVATTESLAVVIEKALATIAGRSRRSSTACASRRRNAIFLNWKRNEEQGQ